jgi:lipopolysaccharide transport system ATP-binding protein
MSDVVIQVENLSKVFSLNKSSGKGSHYTSLRDVVSNSVKSFFHSPLSQLRSLPFSKNAIDEYRALSDISFEINKGDRLGIIGRNGAGKSTLLKLLSRITEPTKGKITIEGRVASLLEVGTGFHPELTGRENIYLNGAILGMSRSEIRNKFDEIVEFAEVKQFLDTPVKRYSSGMYVRLAFSVAAHLEPEILIVDEVLAVGDAAFQRKCIGKMDDVSKDGRTILFVSHNMALVSNLCQKGLVLDQGKLSFMGPISDAVISYYGQSSNLKSQGSGLFYSDNAKLLFCDLVKHSDSSQLFINQAFTIRMAYSLKRKVEGKCVPNFHFFSADGTCAFVSMPEDVSNFDEGDYYADCKIPANFLNEGTYFVGVALTTYPGNGSYNIEFYDQSALNFNIIDPMDSSTRLYDYLGPIPGVIRPSLNWDLGSLI